MPHLRVVNAAKDFEGDEPDEPHTWTAESMKHVITLVTTPRGGPGTRHPRRPPLEVLC